MRLSPAFARVDAMPWRIFSSRSRDEKVLAIEFSSAFSSAPASKSCWSQFCDERSESHEDWC